MKAIILLLAAALWCGMVHAQVPHKLNYQGFLTNPSGTPINASLAMVFKLYDVASGGAALYTETQTVAVNNGVFDVVLGAVAPLNLAFDVPYYLGVGVGVDPEMTPRQLVKASPYALRAANADALAPAATVAGAQITGTIVTAQIANNAVTQATLSPVAGAAAGKVLGTDGSNLQWQTAGAGTVTSLTQGAGVTLTPNPITGSGTIAVDPASSTLTGNFFKQGGNSFGATAVLGTTDNQALDIRVNGTRVMRYEPIAGSANVIGGSSANYFTGVVSGIVIAGGGSTGSFCYDPDTGLSNRSCANGAGDWFGSVGGGESNFAYTSHSVIGGGLSNRANGVYSVVGGGVANYAGGWGSTVAGGGDSARTCINPSTGLSDRLCGNRALGSHSSVGGGKANVATGIGSTVGGGLSNTVSADYSTVGGGITSTANGIYSTVGGGGSNTSSGWASTVGGGSGNSASGNFSTVAGGSQNTASGYLSFAAGFRAKTQTAGSTPTVHNGAFVWADDSGFDFYSAAPREFSARATGGVRFVTSIDGAGTPTRAVSINPNGELSFGSVTRQMLNLWGTTWGVGVQNSTMYHRTGNHFAWFLNGTHSDTSLDAGAGGSVLMTLTNGSPGGLPAVTGVARAQTFTSTSDRNAKEAFAVVDGEQVLAALVQMPLQSWKYRNEDAAVRHVGPTAQDFRATFGIGYDDKTIATVDADGIALAAIQGLNAKVKEQLAAKNAEINALRMELAELRRAVELLMAPTSPEERLAQAR